ncbi:hypothetical protein CHARACLAT_020843 [Characodon lateralis]|uniref:Uncharacterized protein n=1 Tax=Characodon lateralis TaxID=208331 RepID=A0ABU7DIE3_9TELE|nr:hypothetical protein [Characodon lateralis]
MRFSWRVELHAASHTCESLGSLWQDSTPECRPLWCLPGSFWWFLCNLFSLLLKFPVWIAGLPSLGSRHSAA